MFSFIAHHVSGSPYTYLLILGVCAGDALLPLLPAETIVITGAVLAANGKMNIGLVVLATFFGAVVGDNIAYGVGRSGLRRAAVRLLRSAGGQKHLAWARTQLRRSGASIIIIARFIPGGRSAVAYVSGTLELPWRRRFLPADTAACVAWALYASGLGYFGGTAFENNLWLPLLIATGLSLVVAGVGEFVRRRLQARDRSGGPGKPVAEGGAVGRPALGDDLAPGVEEDPFAAVDV